MNKVLGVLIIALALAIIVIPQFTSCEAQGRMLTLANGKTTPMKCTWTARAEIATGVPVLVIGLMMLFANKKESQRYLGGLGAILGIFVMLLPTVLIGVCSGNMVCHTVMKPSLLTLGTLVTAFGLIGMMLSFRKGRE
jgi:hypothetical protein